MLCSIERERESSVYSLGVYDLLQSKAKAIKVEKASVSASDYDASSLACLLLLDFGNSFRYTGMVDSQIADHRRFG
jgi:hypothetical protein